MIKLSEKYPQYNFAKHKGYGTREHINALKFMENVQYIEKVL